jgi:hypothetical protein
MDDWQKIAAPGGGMGQLTACVNAGKARFRGISSHHPDVLLAAIPSGLCTLRSRDRSGFRPTPQRPSFTCFNPSQRRMQ